MSVASNILSTVNLGSAFELRRADSISSVENTGIPPYRGPQIADPELPTNT